MESRRRFILDVHYEIIDPLELRWIDIEKMYGYPTTVSGKKYRAGDMARYHYLWYNEKGRKRNQWAPGKPIEERDSVENLTLKSRWQVQEKGGGVKWLESYKNDVTIRDLEMFKRDLMVEVKNFSPSRTRLDYQHNPGDITYVISLPDLHFGKQSIERTAREFDECFWDLVSREDNVRQYVIPIGNDLFQTEGLRGTTTRGTKVQEFSEWKRCFNYVWKFFAERIIELSEKAPVHIPIVQGNHDWERTFYMGEVLYAYFYNDENIVVDNSFEPRKYLKVGNTLMGWDHGEIKPSEYPLIMAVERPQEFGSTYNRIMFTGHLHSQQNYEFQGVQVRFLPSICPADEWHKRKGYNSMKAAQGFRYNDDGLLGYEESRL